MGTKAYSFLILLLILVFSFQNCSDSFQSNEFNEDDSISESDVSPSGYYDKTYTYSVFVDSSGNDSNKGSQSNQIKSLVEAQSRIDSFIASKKSSLSKKDFSKSQFKVNVFVSGVFFGQVFRWLHPNKNIHLRLVNQPGKSAIFYGKKNPCYSGYCQRDPINYHPIPCESTALPGKGACNSIGLTFFGAPGTSSSFSTARGYDGYGKITIQGLAIKNYWSAINIYAREDSQPNKVTIEDNNFYNIGQIGNPGQWPEAYSAITLKQVSGALIKNNNFIDIINLEKGTESFLHAVYISHNCDRITIRENYFRNISGNPIKVRDGSDFAQIINNKFFNGIASVKLFPVQNWYANWYRDDNNLPTGKKRELPSMHTYMNGNEYLGGYLDSPIALPGSSLQEQLCLNKTVATPNRLPASYSDHAEKLNTYARFNIRGKKIYHKNIAPIRCDSPLQSK